MVRDQAGQGLEETRFALQRRTGLFECDVRPPEHGRNVWVTDHVLGELRDTSFGSREVPHHMLHHSYGRVERPVPPDRPVCRPTSMDLAWVEHQYVARADEVGASTIPGQGSAALGHRNHELLVGVRREGELHVTGAEQVQPAEDVNPPEPGLVAWCEHVAGFQAVHEASLPPNRRDVQDSLHPPGTMCSAGRHMHCILFYDVVADFVAKRAQFRAAHLELARRAHERGELVLAGALADPVDGAVLIFRGPSPQPAEAFAKADPYVTNGLVTRWRVRKWITVVGEGASPP